MNVNLSDIVILPCFQKSKPSIIKLNKCRSNYRKGIIDRKIIVNKNNELLDGYILYLVLKENNVKEVDVQVDDIAKQCFKTPITYIYAKHNQSSNKEYIWYIPRNNNSEAKSINIGDVILVKTKYGNRHVTVTRKEVLNYKPINMNIKKVLI
ncbi:hypothetical protein KQI61_15295 [Anaerocolumna aminovalerica]|uniref:DUF5839 family protein n=1 Tax=Anaerocolumna aminovalerica TaxID=1527 RepID=UPI001C0F1354|nr:DUF5839 family protein [Anaerocolumna aminovalerica]MBU5333564.1 hypothetical protein [Anaerocolumna aminovalerica]